MLFFCTFYLSKNPDKLQMVCVCVCVRVFHNIIILLSLKIFVQNLIDLVLKSIYK